MKKNSPIFVGLIFTLFHYTTSTALAGKQTHFTTQLTHRRDTDSDSDSGSGSGSGSQTQTQTQTETETEIKNKLLTTYGTEIIFNDTLLLDVDILAADSRNSVATLDETPSVLDSLISLHETISTQRSNQLYHATSSGFIAAFGFVTIPLLIGIPITEHAVPDCDENRRNAAHSKAALSHVYAAKHFLKLAEHYLAFPRDLESLDSKFRATLSEIHPYGITQANLGEVLQLIHVNNQSGMNDFITRHPVKIMKTSRRDFALFNYRHQVRVSHHTHYEAPEYLSLIKAHLLEKIIRHPFPIDVL